MIGKLTEGIRQRSLANEGEVILKKWEATGLLEGLEKDIDRSNMARLLENQAGQLLKEESMMGSAGGSGGEDVHGFASVAFPIVRRVFGGLLAQDLVSVQPMSLPSGLIFFMDFTYAPQTGALAGAVDGESIYGGGRVGSAITGGVLLVGTPTDALDASSDLGYRNLNTGYAHASATVQDIEMTSTAEPTAYNSLSATLLSNTMYDADLVADNPFVRIVQTATSNLTSFNEDMLGAITVSAGAEPLIGGNAESINDADLLVRRLTFISGSNIHFVFASATSADLGDGSINTSFDELDINYPVADVFQAQGVGGVSGDNTAPGWALESEAEMAEVDIKVDSIAVTAQTKKLKAHWSPELAQDLNAYHNLDAEVELTSVLAEMIAKEIDNEILQDLVKGAAQHGTTYYWSRKPGIYTQLDDGTATTPVGDFTGTVSQWNETLLDTINAVSAVIHRKTLRGGANFIVCSPEVAAMLEFTAGFRANVEVDGDKGSWGARKEGSISGKMDIFVDPGFLRNVVLVGRRGSSFLESGYVYAPYVPLQMTPTVLGVDDFTPRKGVMTRYGKKMVRPDMYGLVVIKDFLLA
tara:strand:+ start:89 stop:1834 length:1746 start_codon:yes stop_codon:yes gene_type:complete